PSVRKADELPRAAGVHRLVAAGAGRDVAARTGRARADVDHVRVGVGNRDGANSAAEEAVRDAAPRQPAIVGLPYAAASRAVIEDERLRTDAGDRGRPSAAAEAERAAPKPPG